MNRGDWQRQLIQCSVLLSPHGSSEIGLKDLVRVKGPEENVNLIKGIIYAYIMRNIRQSRSTSRVILQ